MDRTRLLSAVIIVLIAVAGIAAVLMRNTPSYRTAPEEQPSASFKKPPVMEVPSSSNVAPGFDEQVKQLQTSIQKNPSNVSHLVMLAQLLMDGHRNEEAITYFERAARLQPKNDSILLDLTVCYFNAGKTQSALNTTETILKHDPKNSRALYNKGAILASTGKQADGAKVWKYLLEVAPLSEEAKTVRGHLAMMEKK